MPVIDLKDAHIFIKDGGSNSIEVKIGEGDFSYDEKRNIEYKLNRGNLDAVREGDQVPIEVSFSFQWEWLKYHSADGGTDTCTVEEALKKEGGAAAWVTAGADACEPYAVDIEIQHLVTCGSVLDETITLDEFRWESMPHAVKAGTVNVTGKCNVTRATLLRTAVSES